jgi:hypothetical protein
MRLSMESTDAASHLLTALILREASFLTLEKKFVGDIPRMKMSVRDTFGSTFLFDIAGIPRKHNISPIPGRNDRIRIDNVPGECLIGTGPCQKKVSCLCHHDPSAGGFRFLTLACEMVRSYLDLIGSQPHFSMEC